MGVPTVLYIIALILAIFEELRAQGQSLLAWAVIAIAVGLLWGLLT